MIISNPTYPTLRFRELKRPDQSERLFCIQQRHKALLLPLIRMNVPQYIENISYVNLKKTKFFGSTKTPPYVYVGITLNLAQPSPELFELFIDFFYCSEPRRSGTTELSVLLGKQNFIELISA